MLYLFLAFLNGICWRKQLKNVSNKLSILVFKFLFLEIILTEGIDDNILVTA